MTASELFAAAHGQPCQGDESCHWCGAPCEPIYRHDEAPGPAVRFGNQSRTTALNPAGNWMCNGCLFFRRPLTTIYWHDGGYDDRRCPLDHCWWITDDAAKALRPRDNTVYELMLNPPARFVLMLLTPPKEEDGKSERHQPHLAPVNEGKVKGDTELKYMLDNQVRTFTIAELQSALEQGSPDGVSGGTRLLLEFFSMTDKYLKKPGPGRPKQTRETAEA